MNTPQKFLNDAYLIITSLHEAKKRFSRQLAPNFSIFDYLQSDEMGLSNCLASLLTPQGAHGQGELFLLEFFKLIDLAGDCQFRNKISTNELLNCKVQTEKMTEHQRRIDIFLRMKSAVVGIENKPWAVDQHNQLFDYANFLKGQAKDASWLLVYISNREPAKSSISPEQLREWSDSRNFIVLNYSQLCEWLRACSAQTSALAVRVFIEELEKFIRKNINGETDMTEKQEMKSLILSSTQNLTAAFHAANAIDDVKNELLDKFRQQLEVLLEEEGLKLVWTQSMTASAKSYSGFGVKFNDNQDKYLRFEFDGPQLYKLFWGIRRANDTVKHDKKLWDEINASMTDLLSSGKQSPWWAWYTDDLSSELSPIPRNWGSSPLVWQMIQEDKLAPIIVKLALKVRSAFAVQNYDLLMTKSL